MLFNSFIFLVFAAIFFAIWPWIRRTPQPRWAFLTAASFLFYGWWDWRFLFLLAGSGLLDYYAALGMEKYPQRRKLMLGLSIAGNIGSLATFKYLGFFSESLNALLNWSGSGMAVPVIHLALPVGISFYTFQSMSYTIDVYRKEIKPTQDILHFFAYLSMFPQLVAGPIVRAKTLLPQLRQCVPITEAAQWEGMQLIAFGFFKKVVLADHLAVAVNAAFGAHDVKTAMVHWWVVMTMFAMQIYYDFSGYSDIARGLGKWMGLDFQLNFNHPYVATSMRNFWERWHISLSTWFRDYVYIPLGGSKGTQWMAMRTMAITMVVSGLWHGAAWHFVIWGAVHALFLAIERLTQWPKRFGEGVLGRLTVSMLLIVQVWVAWVFFRAESTGQALQIIQAMFDIHHIGIPTWFDLPREPRRALILAVLIEMFFYVREHFGLIRMPKWSTKLAPLGIAIVLVLCVYFRGPGGAFIYFQF